MSKNVAIILLIFLVPWAIYWGVTRDKQIAVIPSVASTGPEIIKFSSPMCFECQEMEKIFDEVYPEFANKISLRKIDVNQKDKGTKELIKKHEVQLVPTCVFTNKNGDVIRKTEGLIQPKILENYMKEQING